MGHGGVVIMTMGLHHSRFLSQWFGKEHRKACFAEALRCLLV
jgi:hypothetical protein